MLERSTRQLDAVSEVDLPPRQWAELTDAVEAMTSKAFRRGRVGLRVMDDATIRALNRRFRNTDSTTDVLSFPAGHSMDRGHVGDIALSWETTLRQAAANGNSELDEALALVAHGLLHLSGHDHDTAASDARMHAATLELLAAVKTEVSVFGH